MKKWVSTVEAMLLLSVSFSVFAKLPDSICENYKKTAYDRYKRLVEQHLCGNVPPLHLLSMKGGRHLNN